MKRFLINSGLVFASLFISFICIELITRLFVDMPSPYAMKPGVAIYDERGFWSMEPDYNGEMDNKVDFRAKLLQIEANSSRHVPCASQVNSSALKVYLLGDSQTFGWGLADEETWANRAQCHLKNAPFKVLNLGVPGIQTDQIVTRGIQQVLPSIKENDVVIISLTWNDLIDFYVGIEWVNKALLNAGLSKIENTDKNEPPEVQPIIYAVHPEPKINALGPIGFQGPEPYRRLSPATWRYTFYQKYGIFVPVVDSFDGFVRSMDYVSVVYRHIQSSARLLYYRVRASDSFFSKLRPLSFQLNFLSLKALSHRLEQRGAKVLIQLLPNRLFYDDFYYSSYAKNGIVFPARDYMWHVAKPLCDSLKLKCVNRFPDLNTPTPNAHNFAYDGHYNEAAAMRIGAALAHDIKTIVQSPN